MYDSKVSQNEQNKEDLAVKAFDLNNDSSLEKRVEEVVVEPVQTKQLPLKVKTYKALSRLPKFLGGKVFDDSYKNCLYDFETLDLWDERRRTLNALEDCYKRYYRDNNVKLKSSIASLEETARSLSEKIEAKYKEIYGEPATLYSQKPRKRLNPEITQEDIDAFRNGVDQLKQKNLGLTSDIIIASTCLGIFGAAGGVTMVGLVQKLTAQNFPQTITILNWPYVIAGVLGFAIGGCIGYLSQKDYSSKMKN